MTELELVDAEFSEKESSMTSSPDNTVDMELVDYRVMCNVAFSEKEDGFYTQAEYEDAIKFIAKQAKQSLDSHYLSIFLELVGEPEKGMESKITKTPNGLVIDEWGDIASGFRNALRQELRTALQDRLGEK